MKRTIILNVILLISFTILTITFIFMVNLNYVWNIIEKYIIYLRDVNLDTAKEFENLMPNLIIYEIFIGIAAAVDLIAIILIDIPLLKILFNKEARAEAKASRIAAKAEKAEADKKAKIEALEAQLEELKID